MAWADTHLTERGISLGKLRIDVVYVVTLQGSVCDLFRDAADAFSAAELIMSIDSDKWREVRPGRWWSSRGTLEINEWRIK